MGILVCISHSTCWCYLDSRNLYSIKLCIYEQLGVVGGYILSAGFLPIVSVGLHQALTPIHVLLNNPNGPTAGINYLLPILVMAGGGQVGAGLALYLKTKTKIKTINKRLITSRYFRYQGNQ